MKKEVHSHTPNTRIGSGDYYGTGIRAKIGKVRDGMGLPSIKPKKMGNPPKSLA